jgi:hypothetical protein
VHQTTIRFANDAWERIEREARASGVSAAQYVREATVARLAAGLPAGGEWGAVGNDDSTSARAWRARAGAEASTESSEALWAQARQVRHRAREMREFSKRVTSRRARPR